MRPPIGAALAAATALAASPTALAKYSPQLSVSLHPATPNTAAAMTTTILQESGESASKTTRVAFPASFGFNGSNSVLDCTAAQEQADACPETSRIGTAQADTAFGPFGGPVFFTEDFRLLVRLRNFAGVGATAIGTFNVLPDGSVESVFDKLPNVPGTRVRLAIEGGEKALLLTPRVCGPHTLRGRFTSHDDEEARAAAQVEIAGCAERPHLSGLRIDSRPGRTRTKLSWRLSEATGSTRIILERLARNEWRRVTTLTGPGSPGRNTLEFTGRIGPRRLPAGRYRFVLTATGPTGLVSHSRRITFRIARR